MVVKEFSADLFTFFSRDINVEKNSQRLMEEPKQKLQL